MDNMNKPGRLRMGHCRHEEPAYQYHRGTHVAPYKPDYVDQNSYRLHAMMGTSE